MIACLRIPHFAARVLQRDDPALTERPLVLVRYPKGRGRVVATCPQAEGAGVAVGMSVSRARALCPEAQIEVVALSRIRRALEAVMALLTGYSQWIEAERAFLQTACVFVDLGRLRASEGEGLARAMQSRLLESHGLNASIGLAANRFTAGAAAAVANTSTLRLVRPGEEAAFLAPLPVETVALEPETARRLDLFGLRQLGQIAVMPRAALLAQFGKEGVRLHRLACGEDPCRVAQWQPPQVERTGQRFEPPLDDRLILEQVLGSLAATLAERLTPQAQTCREITLRLRLTDRSERETHIRLPAPVHQSPALARSLKALLPRLTLTAPVSEVEVLVGRLEAIQPRQLTLFESETGDDPRLALLAVSDRWETARFYTASIALQTYLPEAAFALQPLEAA